jgi:DNA-binding CsgD family transcriptional regulator
MQKDNILTERQMEAYRLYQDGNTIAEVGEKMGLGTSTAQTHLEFAREKVPLVIEQMEWIKEVNPDVVEKHRDC